MSDIICTITKNGRCDKYGRPLTVGMSYTASFEEVRGLYLAGFASVADKSVFDDDAAPGGSYFAPIPAGTLPVASTIDQVTGRIYISAAGSLGINDFWQIPAIAIMGDSINHQSTNATGGVNTVDRGIVPWMLAYLGQPWSFEPSDNFAVAGTTLDVMIAGQLPALIAAASTRKYKRVFLSAGTNDTNAGRSIPDIKADYITVFKAIWSIGAIPVMWGILPRGADGAITNAKRQNQQINEWLWLMAQAGALEYIDIGETIADNSTAFGNIVAGFAYDGLLHPNTKGANLLGRALADYYVQRGVKPGLKFATQQGDQFDRTYNPAGVAFNAANPLLQGGTTAPTGMTATGGTWSKVSRTLQNGQTRSDCQCALAASTTHYLYDDWTTTGAWTASQLQPGDIIEARALVEITSGVGINNVNIQLAENNGTGATQNYGLGAIDAGIVDNTSHVLYLKTPRIAVRDYAGSGNCSIFARANIVTGAGASGTAVVKALEVRKVG